MAMMPKIRGEIPQPTARRRGVSKMFRTISGSSDGEFVGRICRQGVRGRDANGSGGFNSDTGKPFIMDEKPPSAKDKRHVKRRRFESNLPGWTTLGEDCRSPRPVAVPQLRRELTFQNQEPCLHFPSHCPTVVALTTVNREPGQDLSGAAISGVALCEGHLRRANQAQPQCKPSTNPVQTKHKPSANKRKWRDRAVGMTSPFFLTLIYREAETFRPKLIRVRTTSSPIGSRQRRGLSGRRRL